MLFFFKKSKVIVDCFTSNASAFEFAKPNNAIKFIPDWWRNIPKSHIAENNFFEQPTLKQCDGVINNFKHGLVLPMWCDFAVEFSPKGTNYFRYQFADKFSEASAHNTVQFNNYIKDDEIQHLKFHSPWFLSCKENIYWVWIDPKWNTIKVNDYVVLPGISSFKYQSSTNINILFYREEKTKKVEIKYGTPLVHMIPLTDKKLVLKHHLVDQNEIPKLKLTSSPIKFTNSVQIFKKVRLNKQ